MMAEVEGFSKERIDELAALLPQMIDSGMVTDESTAYELLKDEDPELYDLASQVFDTPSTISQHACGLAFGTRDRPLHLWVPSYRIASSDAVVTQYNMKYIEEMGLTKQDWLKLDTLKIMRRVLQLIGKDDRYLDEMPLDDKDTFELLREGKTEGVHSFQGATQRRGCIEVKPESIHDLVVIQALYRPSGTRTGFVTAYVNRRFGQEDWEPSNNPHIAANLADTFGLPIFQEQIMQAGADMGMSGAEIDDMYKAIKTAKGIGRGAEELFAAFKPTYMKYALKHTDKDSAEDDWRLFDAFQGYGFNRGHATSYALLGYRNGFLKTHHRREFYTSILEAYPDNPSFTAATIADGFKFEPPDVNSSAGGFSPGTTDKSIRIGLLRVRDVGVGAVGDIVRNQPFSSLDDLRERTSANKVDKTVVDNLRAIGALSPFGIKGDDDDVTSFQLLKFVPRKPVAFKGCKPQIRSRRGGSWTFRGLMTGFERFADKSFCAKMFWLPPLPMEENDKGEMVVSTKLLAKKASAMGSYYAWLLTAVDVNGLPFDLIVSDKKDSESKLVRLLAKQNAEPGLVICVEGQPTQPFLRGRPTGFRLWGIAGADDGNPQMWHCDEETAKLVSYLADEKRRERRAA
jgi:DNA polymerase III alpha subunit